METLIRERLRAFLREDVGNGDLTSELVVAAEARATAHVVTREAGVVAGLREARILGELADLQVECHAADGDAVEAGRRVVALAGSAGAILAVERTLLNVMSHASGVATATRAAADNLRGTGARVAATRKTIPGLRWLQKRAVILGGGDPHRTDLGDAVLIKDNHIVAAGGVAEALTAARAASFTAKIEIEVETEADALIAARLGADIVMLDNMSPERIRAVVASLQAEGLRDAVLLEASGGITPENARAFAEAGADVVSMGALTASARSLDLSLEFETG